MTNLNMDLTGLHASYAMRDRVYRIFKYGQLVDLESVIFKDTLKVYMISSGLGAYELTYGEDYDIPEQFVSSCDNDMSAAKLIQPTFDRELISGIRMLRGVENDYYTIQIEAQQLYPNQIRTAYFHNTPIQVTPELIQDIIYNLEQLNIQAKKVVEVSDLSDTGLLYLEMDETETNMNNLITDEEHLLSVTSGRFMIHPKGGSFYKDSVKVKHPATGSVLQEGIDYFIVGMNVAKTKATSSTSPVYDFILVSTPIVGEVLVTYHAFGGETTIDNFKELLQDVNNIQQYLKDAKALTVDSLGSTEIMTSLFERIDKLETKMRRLEGTPSYGDVTSGKSILMKLFTDRYPSSLNWWTIASLYTTLGNQAPCTADTFIFRFQGHYSHMQFIAAVAVDLNNIFNNKFNVNIISENTPRGFVPFNDYAQIERIIRPQLRVIWNDSPKASGALLQLGFELKGMMEETICIEDISGHESCWKLVDEIKGVSLPANDNVMLPNQAIWSTSLEESKQESILMPFKKGHLLWAGAVELNRPVDGWNYKVFTEDLFIDPSTDVSRITKLRLNLQEDAGMVYAVDIPFNSEMETLSGRTVDIYNSQPAYYNAEITKKDNGVELLLNYDVTAGVDANKLILRDMLIYTNQG